MPGDCRSLIAFIPGFFVLRFNIFLYVFFAFSWTRTYEYLAEYNTEESSVIQYTSMEHHVYFFYRD